MRLFLTPVVLLLLAGCANMGQHIFVKNYKIGEVQTVNVGDPMVKIWDYYHTYRDGTDLCYYGQPSSDFTVSGEYTQLTNIHDVAVAGKAHEKYLLKDRTEFKGKEYQVFYVRGDDGSSYGFMVDQAGKVMTDVIFKHDIAFECPLTSSVVKPNPITMKITNERCGFSSNGYFLGNKDFELIYGGRNSLGVNITYREFTKDNPPKPSFFQNLVFGCDVKTIRFKTLKIDLIEANNEKVVFRVLEDHLQDRKFSLEENDIDAFDQVESRKFK